MGNVVNYIKWRGDLEFSNAPFNEVDNLALALLVYNDFDGIIPAKGVDNKISVKDASEWYFTMHTTEGLSKLDFDWIGTPERSGIPLMAYAVFMAVNKPDTVRSTADWRAGSFSPEFTVNVTS